MAANEEDFLLINDPTSLLHPPTMSAYPDAEFVNDGEVAAGSMPEPTTPSSKRHHGHQNYYYNLSKWQKPGSSWSGEAEADPGPKAVEYRSADGGGDYREDREEWSDTAGEGNCEVFFEAGTVTCHSDSTFLRISASKNATIKISVNDKLGRMNNDEADHAKTTEREEENRVPSLSHGYTFVLVNPKDGASCCKYYLQEVLKMYTEELPAMNYSANTGKRSMFLQRCVSNGKYCTLLLKSNSIGGNEEVIAAITYQIVPVDTQYAEVPLAAVRTANQHKGLGRFLFMELRRRLQSVGIRTIYCWADEESKGFWLKQGFSSIAEVDRKGRARRLPIKADIRKALCFPGGSTLMVSHLNVEGEREQLVSSLDPFVPGTSAEHAKLLTSESYHREGSEKEGKHDKKTADGFATKGGAEADCKSCSCNSQGQKKRVWEISLSSLKTKKVKGSHGGCNELNYGHECKLENARSLPPSRGISDNLTGESLLEVTPSNGGINCSDSKGGPVNMLREAVVGQELGSKGAQFRIMLMNIADDAKKNQLIEVIEKLGGSVTASGNASTHVVTGKVRATVNFCSALSSGAWILSSSWLKESFRQGKFADEIPHLLADEEYKAKFGIELKVAVSRARANPGALFKGYNICMAKHVHPPIATLSAIVKCAGGDVIPRLANVKQACKAIYIACEETMEEALSAANKGVLTFSSEWLINCILRQELDLAGQQFAESLS